MNLIDFFDKNVRNFPQRPGIVYENQTWTYAQLDSMVLRIAHGLKDLGVERETPCAVISRNHPLAFLALLGILKSRGSWVPLNTGNAEDDHLYILEHFDVGVLFYQKEFATFAQRVRRSELLQSLSLQPRCPRLCAHPGGRYLARLPARPHRAGKPLLHGLCA